MEDLQRIKDEVAQGSEFIRFPTFYDHTTIPEYIIDQIAIRYAEEQNKELLEMLETVIKDYENIIPQSPARDNRIQQIKELINKHKGIN